LSQLQIRFVLNRVGGQTSEQSARRRSAQFAQVIVHDVAVAYAERAYETLKGKIEFQIREAVQKELNHISSLYRRLVVGRVNGAVRTDAKLTTVTAGEDQGSPLSGPIGAKGYLPAWAPLNAKYVERKAREGRGRGFFSDRGLLAKELGSKDWTRFFGPIRIRVVRKRSFAFTPKDASVEDFFAEDGHERIAVASVEVSAYGKVTPEMLNGQGRLINLVDEVNPTLALHLAGSSRYVPYRPSLEPFVEFAITRSIPAAVFSQLRLRD
jgi:hypothetical protein